MYYYNLMSTNQGLGIGILGGANIESRGAKVHIVPLSCAYEAHHH